MPVPLSFVFLSDNTFKSFVIFFSSWILFTLTTCRSNVFLFGWLSVSFSPLLSLISKLVLDSTTFNCGFVLFVVSANVSIEPFTVDVLFFWSSTLFSFCFSILVWGLDSFTVSANVLVEETPKNKAVPKRTLVNPTVNLRNAKWFSLFAIFS